jgi:hypothetical protein
MCAVCLSAISCLLRALFEDGFAAFHSAIRNLSGNSSCGASRSSCGASRSSCGASRSHVAAHPALKLRRFPTSSCGASRSSCGASRSSCGASRSSCGASRSSCGASRSSCGSQPGALAHAAHPAQDAAQHPPHTSGFHPNFRSPCRACRAGADVLVITSCLSRINSSPRTRRGPLLPSKDSRGFRARPSRESSRIAACRQRAVGRPTTRRVRRWPS